MPECRYCDRAFDTEDAIREHLYAEHDRGDLSRIDRKRVEQYIEAEGLSEAEDSDVAESTDSQSLDRSLETAGQADRRRSHDQADRTRSHGRWERHKVEDLSTEEITGKLERLGIETNEKRFRERAETVDSARELCSQWFDHHEVDVSEREWEFVWMAVQVLWRRWTPEIPSRERILELVDDGFELLEQNEREAACQQWLTAWKFIEDVTSDDVTSLEEAKRRLPGGHKIESMLRSLEAELQTLGETDPEFHERRIEVCREVCNRFPDSEDELLLDMRHAVGDALADLGRERASRTEFEAIIEAYPEDPWAYYKLAERYWQNGSADVPVEDLERAAELYRASLDHGIDFPSKVTDRLDELEQRLPATETTEGDRTE